MRMCVCVCMMLLVLNVISSRLPIHTVIKEHTGCWVCSPHKKQREHLDNNADANMLQTLGFFFSRRQPSNSGGVGTSSVSILSSNCSRQRSNKRGT